MQGDDRVVPTTVVFSRSSAARSITVTATDSESRKPTTPGATIGRFLVLGKLGSGGMGVVYAAYDPKLGRKVAIKVLRPRPGKTHAAARRIESEAQAMAQLSHPNVVAVYEIDEAGDQPFVAMELVEGSTLRRWLAERQRPWREIVKIFIAAGRGLAAAHAAGLVHRDFKPDNVLIGRDGRPRVSDFGLVRVLADDDDPPLGPAQPGPDITRHGRASGTPGYMSPEQCAGQPVDARSDQFAFCVALWEALCGGRPFRGSEPVEPLTGAVRIPDRRVRVPRRILGAVRRGLAADRNQRWKSMDELLHVLSRPAPPRPGSWLGVALVVTCGVVASALGSQRPDSTGRIVRAAPPLCGKRDQITAVWNPSVRAHYLSGARNAETAREDAGWFDWYARALGAAYAVSCERTDARRISCLNDAVEDLRAAIERNEREYWPRLRAVDHCGREMREIPVTENDGGYDSYDMRMSTDGRQVFVRFDSGQPIIRDLTSGTGKSLDLELPLQWLQDGSIVGEDHHDLVVVDPSIRRRIWSIPVGHRPIAVSSDLRRVALIANKQDSGQLLTIAPISGETPPVETVPFDNGNAGFSPDNQRVAVLGRDLYIQHLGSKHRETLTARIHNNTTSGPSIRWMDAASVILHGSATPDTAGDVWRIALDAAGRVEGPPQILLRAERESSLSVLDAQAGRLLVQQLELHDKTFLLDNGSRFRLPTSLARVYARAADRVHGRVLVAKDRESTRWGWMSPDGSSVESIPALDGLRSATVGPFGLSAIDVGGDLPQYIVFDDTGNIRTRVAIEAARGTIPTLRCGDSRCVIGWITEHAAFLAQVENNQIGAPVRLTQPELMQMDEYWSLSPDGKQIAFPMGVVVLYDLQRKTIQHIASSACRVQGVKFLPDGALQLSGVATTRGWDGWVLVKRDATGQEHILLRSDEWIAGSLALDEHRTFVHTISYQDKLRLFEMP